ncbi:hypothetical protein [Hymenobacter armeniacus]|uniref:Uncharacterized protein n=1 Tax=Hymenobacter armeniacus TaxID=2771358 RepID=A0ABR8JM13_9BACT|nr:hypothetical protein [Hymenobacter armeniacus]MBD2721041.1 hypothetical protein [Hymenobacter armeniacus]
MRRAGAQDMSISPSTQQCSQEADAAMAFDDWGGYSPQPGSPRRATAPGAEPIPTLAGLR